MREDAQTGEKESVEATGQNGETARNGQVGRVERTGRTVEDGRRTVAPERFRVVSASGTISVGVGNGSERKTRSTAPASFVESEKKPTPASDELTKPEILAIPAGCVDSSDSTNSDDSVRMGGSGGSGGSEDLGKLGNPSNPDDLGCLNGELRAPDDEFDDENAFFASFSNGADASRETETFDDAFAGGLRSIFDAESEDDEDDATAKDGESDAERFQRDLERERRESLDGVLLQNDSDFLREAGEKYERPRVSNADFERKSGSAAGRVGGNGGNGENSESVEAVEGRRVPIGPASILEAMLFVGDRENRPLTLARATELMRNVSETEALEALADLNERYWRDGAPYRIVRDGDGFRMALRPEFDALAARFVGGKTKEFKLTQTMIDVLALIAYRQPISLDEILETRNNATGALAQLVKRELVAQEKRVVDKKKVAFYSTTPRFLRLFNLESLDDLPIVGDVDYR